MSRSGAIVRRTRRPSSVSTSVWPEVSKSRKPRAASSCAIRRLTTDGSSSKAFAALRKLRKPATRTKSFQTLRFFKTAVGMTSSSLRLSRIRRTEHRPVDFHYRTKRGIKRTQTFPRRPGASARNSKQRGPRKYSCQRHPLPIERFLAKTFGKVCRTAKTIANGRKSPRSKHNTKSKHSADPVNAPHRLHLNHLDRLCEKMGKRLSADDLNTPEKREHLARERKSCADGPLPKRLIRTNLQNTHGKRTTTSPRNPPEPPENACKFGERAAMGEASRRSNSARKGGRRIPCRPSPLLEAAGRPHRLTRLIEMVECVRT